MDNDPEKETKLIIIIPALNEEKTIGSVIQGIPESIQGITSKEIVVVNDGSSDATADIATSLGAHIVHHARQMGVGAAFQGGLCKALQLGGDIIVNIDADGQFNPEDIPKLIHPIQQKGAQFVSATRFKDPALMPRMPGVKVWGNKWVTRLVNIITRRSFTDVSCGFRAYTREAALKLTLFGHFTYTQETFIDLAFKDMEIVEVPLKVRGEREFGTSRVASSLWRYGIKSATIMFRTARDYKPFYFIGVPGIIIMATGIGLGIFLVYHYTQTGQTYPYRSLVNGSGILIIIGFLLLFISLIADMIHRNRILIEELLYLARKREYDREE